MHTIDYHLHRMPMIEDRDDALNIIGDIILDWRDGYFVKSERDILIDIVKQVSKLKKILPTEKEQEND